MTKELTEYQHGVQAVCDVCGWNVKLMAGRAARLYKALTLAGGTWMQVYERYSRTDPGHGWWWYREDWRGKRGDWPTDASIRETWERATQPIAVAPQTGAAALLAYVQELRANGDAAGSD